ncbi:hypothetical protein AB4874_15380 [Thioclava sp. 15-R06ZXC-3]|uniref:Autotransporter domain-containing protein n=1 Tax=Thioclava arctica TaxID=3238301 RepID=A0ABV3TN44_9RHOB
MSHRSLLLLAFVASLLPVGANAFEIGVGYEGLNNPRTPIEGLARVYFGRDLGRGISFGQSIYAGAKGDGGGAFFWGVEGIKRFALSERISLNTALFLGGGGGAAVVVGDGFMTRAGIGFGYALSERVDAELGASYIKIAGADIENTALTAGLTWHIGAGEDQRALTGSPLSMPLRSVSIRGSYADMGGSRDRTGAPQTNLKLAGAEASFLLGGRNELVLSGDGAASGGEGYMQIFGGLRHRIALGQRASVYGQAALGFGGGGQVDTGGGVLLDAGLGVSVALLPWADFDLSVGKTLAPDGDMNATVARIGLTRVFRRSVEAGPVSAQPQHWAYTLGISMQDPNTAFRKAGATATGKPVMQESSIDLFLNDKLYVTGNAQTALGGDVAGYAIGMLGLGWRQPIADRWAISLEGRVGAAGGGGVDVAGGVIGSVAVEADYALNDTMSLSVGLGKIKALKGGGMAPTTLTAGLKFPFTTH